MFCCQFGSVGVVELVLPDHVRVVEGRPVEKAAVGGRDLFQFLEGQTFLILRLVKKKHFKGDPDERQSFIRNVVLKKLVLNS